MKKFVYLTFCLIFCLTVIPCFSACEKEIPLSEHVVELRSDIFTGSDETYTVKAGYGFLNGEASKLTVKLAGKYAEDVTYTASVTHNGETYKSTFAYNPVKCSLIAELYVPDFTEKQFVLDIASGSNNAKITLNSIVPENAIDYRTALKNLSTRQSDLVDLYYDDEGNFTADIVLRIIVKDQSPYWYVGLKKGDDLKALLIDGVSGEVLAVREIL